MKNWTSGYVADIGYTYGYYSELNPSRAELAFLYRSLMPAKMAGTHCELGYGQGLSVNIHAAATGSEWYGSDFNPSQAVFANALSQASGAKAHLTDESFAEFCTRPDLPDFDSIGLHGIWSWISDENRSVIADFIRRKLKVGGVAYVSYNTLPGWSSFAPMRHLMTEHASSLGVSGFGTIGRVDGALEFAEKFLETNPIYTQANTNTLTRLKKIKEQSRSYIAHEYFNRDWLPMHFADIAKIMGGAKLEFACSANYLDHIDALNLTKEQQDFIKKISDPIFSQTVRDFMVNQQFRRDYWVKGSVRLTKLEQVDRFRKLKIVLQAPAAAIALKVNGYLGESTLNTLVYENLLQLLSDHCVRSLEDVFLSLKDKGVNFSQIIEAVMILSAQGHIGCVQDETLTNNAQTTSQKLNRYLMEKTRAGGGVSFLASPLTGGGLAVGKFEQLFVLAREGGEKQPEELAKSAWGLLASQNQAISKDGKPLAGAAENLQELQSMAKTFLEKTEPILTAMKIM